MRAPIAYRTRWEVACGGACSLQKLQWCGWSCKEPLSKICEDNELRKFFYMLFWKLAFWNNQNDYSTSYIYMFMYIVKKDSLRKVVERLLNPKRRPMESHLDRTKWQRTFSKKNISRINQQKRRLSLRYNIVLFFLTRVVRKFVYKAWNHNIISIRNNEGIFANCCTAAKQE